MTKLSDKVPLKMAKTVKESLLWLSISWILLTAEDELEIKQI